MAARRPAVIMDCGTGYTKMGYGGNTHPSYVIPTQIATRAQHPGKTPGGVEDLDFFIGDEAEEQRKFREQWVVESPIEHGQIKNWDYIERFWQHCVFKYLKVEPEEHTFMLTEPPMNAPENREFSAEIMFETFNVKGCHIAVQAVLALYAAYASSADLTGTVIDSGDGVTHVIPIAYGYVQGSNIRTMDIAGKDITRFIQSLMEYREPEIPRELRTHTAKVVKERYCYTCPDMVKEFQKYDKDGARYILDYEGVNPRDSSKKWHCQVGYERFLGPEVFFNPEIAQLSSKDTLYKVPLSRMVYDSISRCSIDLRKPLVRNIVLSGGSSLFKDFGKRLERDIKKDIKAREKRNEEMLGEELLRKHRAENKEAAMSSQVKVVSHEFQRFAVWFGGSIVSSQPNFDSVVVSRSTYAEHGPSVMRRNIALSV